MVDLGEAVAINRWVVKHAQEGGEPANMNTRDFKLQYSNELTEFPESYNSADWTDIEAVSGNTPSKTDRDMSETINARFVCLYVTRADHTSSVGIARINELELYGTKSVPASADYEFAQNIKKR
jgi:mannosyl-glycoprotein endo-beta-N-acetylglucosaminidase